MPATPVLRTLNLELRAQLVRRERTQTEVADLLGIPQSQVSSRLRGQTEWRLAEFVQLVRTFGLDLDALMAAAVEDAALVEASAVPAGRSA